MNSEDTSFWDYYYDLVSPPSVGSGTAIGGSLSSDTTMWRRRYCGSIIFDRVLTYEEIVELETYLKRKWGIM